MGVQISLPEVVVEELRKRAARAGISLEEYLIDIATRDLDPNSAAEKYLMGAKQLLQDAKQELEKGDLRQASEKIWGACALAIKAHALAKRGTRLESHRDLWVYKNEVAKELGDLVRTAFLKADSMHRNFYEGLATREDVEDSLKDVENLVERIAESIKSDSTSSR